MKITTPFQGWQARFEHADDGFFFGEEKDQDWFSSVLAETHKCEMAPIDKPLELPPESLLDLYRLAWFADMHSDVVLELSAPGACPNFQPQRPQTSPRVSAHRKVRPCPWRQTNKSGKWPRTPMAVLDRWGKLLQDLIYLMRSHWQAGSVWQLHAAPKREPEWDKYSEVRLRFGGVVIEKQGQTPFTTQPWTTGTVQ